MSLSKKIKIVLFLLVMACVSSESFAQCNAFTKKRCMPSLTPYVHNGQLNSANMGAGETAELELTFYSGQEYRVLLCGQEILGDISFKLKDKNSKVVYDSKEAKSNQFDFNVKSTQQLTMEVVVPENKTPNNLATSGCISVLVGFKK
jgi:hypothetical protein